MTIKNIPLVITQVQSTPDLRCTGCNIFTGYKAVSSLSKKPLNIYMTVSDKSVDLYIKRNNKNVYLKNDTLYNSNVYDLGRNDNWYV